MSAYTAAPPASPYTLAYGPHAYGAHAYGAHAYGGDATTAQERASHEDGAVPYRAHRWMMRRAWRWGMLQGAVLTALLLFAGRWLLVALALVAVVALARRAWRYGSGRARERRAAREAQHATLDADPQLRAALDASAAEAAHFQAHLRDDARQMEDFDRRLREALDAEPSVLSPAHAHAQARSAS